MTRYNVVYKFFSPEIMVYACQCFDTPFCIVPDLYGVNVRPVAPFSSLRSQQLVDTALIHRSLPDELLFEVS